MKRKKIILLVLLIVLLLGGLYGYSEFTRTNKDLLKEKAAFTTDASSLINAFEKDSAAFNKRYTDKVIAVQGVVKRIDASENPVVIALDGGEGLSSVQCSMDSSHAQLYNKIREGETITLKGMCTGGRTDEMFGTDVILNRCVPEAKQSTISKN